MELDKGKNDQQIQGNSGKRSHYDKNVSCALLNGITYHVSHQFWMNFIAENAPPQVQVFGQMFVFLRWIWLLGNWIKVDNPWFHLANEMKNLHVVAEPIAKEVPNMNI